MYDLIIIGGGTAGLSATVYAAREQLNTLLISVDIGGQVNLTLDIENYIGYQLIGGAELIDKFQTQMSQYPVDQKIGDKVTQIEKLDDGFEIISQAGERYQAITVIYAAGKSPRKLNVPGEVELTGKGVTYCAICDGPVFAGQMVAVVGGGNSALGAALDMVKIAEHVNLVSHSPLKGDAILIDKLSDAKNLTIFTGHETERIEGQDFASGMLIKNLKSGEQKRLDVTGVFIEIGLVPNSELVKGLIKLNERGEVPINCSSETAIPGLYAAGDVTDIPEKQIVIAAGEGAKAALRAHHYLQRLARR